MDKEEARDVSGEQRAQSTPSVKHAPGRPKGSKNKPKLTPALAAKTSGKPRGRPRGSGPKQIAAAAAAAKIAATNTTVNSAGTGDAAASSSSPHIETVVVQMPVVKRPVGRPRLHAPPPVTSVNLGRTKTLPGVSAVIRTRAPGTVDNRNPLNLQPIFLNAPRFTVPSPSPHPLPLAGDALSDVGTNQPEASASVPRSHIVATDRVQAAAETETREIDEEDEDERDGCEQYLDDGIGEEPGGEEDEGDGDDDGLASEEGQNSDLKTKRAPHPHALWVMSRFHDLVRASAQRGDNGLPPLYRDHRTFWFPCEDSYFATRNLSVEELTPEALYQCRWLLWDPGAFDKIPCPREGCSSNLVRHGTIKRPRRVVDLDDTFFMIGYRYRCPMCVHSKSGRHTVTFNSWDAAILRKLPRALANSFPAILSHRSAISERVFMFMRSCFQSGMSAKQFSDALRVRHLENYDKLQLAYLSTVARARAKNIWLGANSDSRKFKSFPPFDDRSSTGFHGYIPGSQLLRDLYDRFVELHGPDYNQAISLLRGYLCAIDHSFKLAKHIARVNGEQIFIALLTVTNELGEIRVCNLVATKAHSQFELALNCMRESLERYGHDQPAIFYTDNMADKEFLERCFPSLREDVITVEKYSELPHLELLSCDKIFVMSGHDEINEAMRAILHELPDDSSLGDSLVLFVDSEWNVEMSSRGYITGRGSTAVLQLGFKDRIYILQIGQMLAGSRLPLALKQIFTNPRILKVGRAVHADLKNLQDACASTDAFVGAVDLARLAKDRLVISTAKVGLDDLCARVLGKRLDKNVAERLSSMWDSETLTEAQIKYAALDVHACRCIYDVLVQIPLPIPLPKTAPVGTDVLLFSEDRTCLVARGTISALSGRYQERVMITASQCIVCVLEVVVPGALFKSGKKEIALEAMGSVPFDVIWRRSHIRLQAASNIPSLPRVPSARPIAPMGTNKLSDEAVGASAGQSNLVETLREVDKPSESIERAPFNPNSHAVDAESAAQGNTILNEVIQWKEWRTEIRSRVLKDPFHLFNMFYISAGHSLRPEFARAFRDALFLPDPQDKAKIVDIWLTNEIQEYQIALEDILQDVPERSNWVNGNLYFPSSKVSGVLPIPIDIRRKAGMADFDTVTTPRTALHYHLALLQGTRKAVLPIHNDAEEKLFRDFMSGQHSFGNFTSPKQVNDAVRAWNAEADTQKDIYYKLSEQLKVYYNGKWKRNANIKQTKALTAAIRRPVLNKIRDPKRLDVMPAVPEVPMRLHSASAGLLPLDPPPPAQPPMSPTPNTFSQTAVDSLAVAISGAAGITFVAGSSRKTATGEGPPRSLQSHTQALAKRKVDAAVLTAESMPKNKRAKRSCRRCGKASPGCRGAKEVKYCHNPCRDCGKQDCRGRNPKSPNVECSRAKWNDE
ncbi:unnamed protein product [Mycena citricolor]|uniref:3'-5' exonuclease n=1 Tax=Mycena citricolor TaxID=2018698 RepID=A0AAD2GZB8_9AGAR|nr:unnamed protein product [Mycena citricolor]